MKKLEYIDLKKRRSAFYKEFKSQIPIIESRWTALKNKEKWLSVFRCSAVDLMLGNIDMLVSVYLRFEQSFDAWAVGKTKDDCKKMKEAIASVFNYTAYRNNLVQFFTDPKNGFDIHTCYYCETAYVNLYKYKGSDKNHFDLDHILDKGTCPLLGISMLNLLPSCQCCNEKIKKQKIFGFDKPKHQLTKREIKYAKIRMRKLMPTSNSFDFENMVRLKVLMKSLPQGRGFLKFRDNYQIEFSTIDADYDDYISKLHLRERYVFHKAEALRLLDLRECYTDSTISKISLLLGVTESNIKEDLFSMGFNKDEHRCFSKLKRDIMS